MKVIGLSGGKFNGKSTICKYLIEQGNKDWSFQREAVGAPLKMICHMVFGGTMDHWFGDKKEEMLEECGLTPRRIMQVLGTDCFRKHFGGEVWVRLLERSLKKLWDAGGKDANLCIIVDDVRYDEEARMIQRWGGYVYRIVKLPEEKYNPKPEHDSEKGVSPELLRATLAADDGDHNMLRMNAAVILKDHNLC